MKRTAIGVTAVAFLLSGATAWADCPTGVSVTPSGGGSYSVLFNGTMVASQSAPAVCSDFTVSTAVAPGVIAVYSADYRGGFDDPDGVGRITVTHNGVTDSSANLQDPSSSPGNIFYSHLIGIDSNGDIKSDIKLELLQTATSADTVALDTLDYTQLATANITDIQTSVDQFSADRSALVTHLTATADLLIGAGHSLEDEDGVSVLGDVGSFTAGATGQRTVGEGLTVLGGAATLSQGTGGAATTGMLFSGSLRYLAPDQALVRPYGEVGLITAPVMGISFMRAYRTSNGTTTASGSTTGALFGGFVKGGVLVTPDETNQVALSATLAKDWLITGAYSETIDGSNPFAASAPAQSSIFDTIKAGLDWTTKVAPKTKITLSGAIGQTIAETPVNADVAFGGILYGCAGERDVRGIRRAGRVRN